MKRGNGERDAGRHTRCAHLRSDPFAMGCMVLLATGLANADPGAQRPAPEAFALHCSGCHRLDGHGVPGVAPDLREIGALLDLDGGRDYLGRVPGVAQAPVGDDELAALLNWVLTTIAHTPPNPLYTGGEIAKLRANPLRDPLAARRALLASKP